MIYKIFNSDTLFDFMFSSCGGDYYKLSEYVNDLKVRFKYFNLEYFSGGIDWYVLCLDGEKVVGILNYFIGDRPTLDGDLHFISFVSVDGEYWGRGISKGLLAKWGEIRRTDLGVCGCSGFTVRGFKYLRPQLVALGVKCDDKILF